VAALETAELLSGRSRLVRIATVRNTSHSVY